MNSFTFFHHSVPPDSVFWRVGSVFVIWYEGPNSFGPMQKINITHWNDNSEFALYFIVRLCMAMFYVCVWLYCTFVYGYPD